MKVEELLRPAETGELKIAERAAFEFMAQGIMRGIGADSISLRQFVRESWPIVEPAKTYLDNWHIDLMCEYLEEVTAGRMTRLIFNVPPRMMKSLLVSVMWPDWIWTRAPSMRGLFASYSQSLATKHSIDRRSIIESEWYQTRWGSAVQLSDDENLKTGFMNKARGVWTATSVGGTATGKGGDLLVADDLINPEEAESKAARQAAINFFDRTFSTRLDDKKRGAIVVIEQRTNVGDLTGHLLKGTGWTHVNIPAMQENRKTYIYPRTKRSKEREIGDILWPEREGKKELDAQKLQMGTRAYSAQYDGNPTPAGGTMVDRAWWKFYKGEVPISKRSIWTWDTACKKGTENDPTVGLHIVDCEAGFYLDRHFRARIEYPTLRRQVKVGFDSAPSAAVIVEDKSSGQQVIQDLRSDTKLPIIAAHADKDKITRLSLVLPLIEAGKVFLPEGASWVADFIEEFAAFPDGDHDDQVDALAHGLLYLRPMGPRWRPA